MDPAYTGAPSITFVISRSAEPFKQEDIAETRRLFTTHAHSGAFLDEKHEHMLPNYQTLKDLGPHLLLAPQSVTPERWIDLRLEVRDQEHTQWTTFTLREDNMYCHGFFNELNAYELLADPLREGIKEPAEGEGMPLREGEKEPAEGEGMLPRLLPPNFLPLFWNVHYNTILNCRNNEEVEAVLNDIIQTPDFVADGVCFLSKYQHKEGSEEEATARRYLGGIIYLMIEPMRMNMEANFIGTSEDGSAIIVTGLRKAQIWSIACRRLLNWRDDGFRKWIETDRAKMTNSEKELIEAGLNSGEQGLRLVVLVLNRKKSHHSLLGTRKNKGPKGPGKGGGSKDKGKGPKPKGPGDDSKGGSHGSQGSQGKRDDKGDDRGKGGLQIKEDVIGRGAQDGDYPYYGSCGLQLLDFSANFKIDGVNLFDWHGGQIIYRRSFISNTSSSVREQEKLVLIGPEWPINPLGPLALQIFRSTDVRKRKRTAIQRIPILRSWNVPGCDDDKPAIHHQSFDGETPNEKVNISYMVIPNTNEARCQIFLLLRDCNAGYRLRPRSRGKYYMVSGSVKVSCKQMESFSVDLFSKERNNFKVPCWKETQVPMHTLVCLPHEEFDMTVHFTLKPSMGKREEIGPFVVNFNPSVKTQTHKCEGHTVTIAVNMSK